MYTHARSLYNIKTRNTCMQRTKMQLYVGNMKYWYIVVIATRQFIFFSVFFFQKTVKIMEKYQF